MERYKDLYIPGAIVLVGILVAGAIVYGPVLREDLAQRQAVKAPLDSSAPVEITVADQDHMQGNKTAPVTIVEFSDLQCPFCQQFHPTVQQAIAEYGDKVRVVYKHFPLDIHPQAVPAALAAECAAEQKGEQGFWDFVEAVFENQERIGPALFSEIAQQQGMDAAAFAACVNTQKYLDRVEQDYKQGIAAGVDGTPASFVNGVPVRGAVSFAQLKSLIESALAR